MKKENETRNTSADEKSFSKYFSSHHLEKRESIISTEYQLLESVQVLTALICSCSECFRFLVLVKIPQSDNG